MTDFVIEHRAALGDKKSSSFMGVKLEVLPEGHVLHALAGSADGDLSGAIRTTLGLEARWPCASSRRANGSSSATMRCRMPKLTGIAERLKHMVDIVDQSHGRVRIGLSGEKATAVLAKGTAADLALAAFPVGHATTTLIGHIGAHITRTGETAFELMVLRGFCGKPVGRACGYVRGIQVSHSTGERY